MGLSCVTRSSLREVIDISLMPADRDTRLSRSRIATSERVRIVLEMSDINLIKIDYRCKVLLKVNLMRSLWRPVKAL